MENGSYSFEQRNLSIDIGAKLDEIEEYEDGWNMVREEYLKLKNRNKDINKKSFILYLESINNVHNQLMQYEKKKVNSKIVLTTEFFLWVHETTIGKKQ